MGKDRLIELLAKKLSGNFTLQERRELADMLNTDESLELLSRQVSKLMDMQLRQRNSPEDELKKEQDWIQVQRLMDQIPPGYLPLHTRKRSRARKFWWAAAVALAVASTVIMYRIVMPEKPLLQESGVIATKKGSKSSILLPDGSRVWINSDSRLSYKKGFGKQHRELVLTGEAYFDVVKDPERPFIIHASQVDIKVLGTAFNVRSYPKEKDIVTTLVRGHLEVQVHKGRDSGIYHLNADEKLIIKKRTTPADARPAGDQQEEVVWQRIKNKTDSIPPEAQWTQNRLVFIDTPLGEIAEILSRWYDMRVAVGGDDQFKNRRFTGFYDDQTVEKVLESLKRAGNINYQIKNSEIIIKP
ncbi:FecR family protein [Niabella terrae]